tara:strand:+ start:1329 stop:1625 length:297 start_codon:yes stop_codon:yes gene_type:complete
MVQNDESVEEYSYQEESYQEESIEKKDSKKIKEIKELNELKDLLILQQELMEKANKLDIVRRNSKKQYKFNYLILVFFIGVFIIGFVFDLIFPSESDE